MIHENYRSNGKSVLVPESFEFIFESDNANSCTPASIVDVYNIYWTGRSCGKHICQHGLQNLILGIARASKRKRKLTHQQSLSSLSSKKKSLNV